VPGKTNRWQNVGFEVVKPVFLSCIEELYPVEYGSIANKDVNVWNCLFNIRDASFSSDIGR